MRFWFKRDNSRARRSSRLWGLRARRAVLALTGLMLTSAVVFAGWHSGTFTQAGDWLRGKSIGVTAAAGFRVENILVIGRQRTPQEEILSRLDIRQGMPLFAVNVGAAQETLADITWVDRVVVSRRLPDTVIVDLQERVPAALWQYQKKISVVDDKGHVLALARTEEYQELPLVVGAGAAEQVRHLKGLLAAEPFLAAAVVSAVRVGQRRWDLHLRNGVIVRLPEQDTELALRRFVKTAQEQDLLGKAVATVDLRVSGQMIVDILPLEAEKAAGKKT